MEEFAKQLILLRQLLVGVDSRERENIKRKVLSQGTLRVIQLTDYDTLFNVLGDREVWIELMYQNTIIGNNTYNILRQRYDCK